MIYLSLGKPDGAGGFTRVAAFSTDDEDRDWTFWPECSILKDYLDSVGSISNRIDCSKARGGIAQGTTFEFSLIDWDETELARRSVGIISGVERFQGWAVDVVRTAGPQAQAPTGTDLDYYGGHEWYFQVDDASVSGDALRLSCVARWSLDGTTVGAGAGDAVVGLVAGGHDVSVETTPEPEPIKYTVAAPLTGWNTGRPGASLPAVTTRAFANEWKQVVIISGFPIPAVFLDEWYLRIECIDAETASENVARIADATANGGLSAIGESYFEQVTEPAFTEDQFLCVPLSPFFHVVEPDATKIYLSVVSENKKAIAHGGASVAGFVSSDGEIVSPKGVSSVDGGVLSFAPTVRSASGFVASTLIPCGITFASGAPPVSAPEVEYYGAVEEIPTAAIPTTGGFAEVDILDPTTLQPVSGTSDTFGAWFELSTTFSLASFTFGVSPLDPDKAAKYSRIFLDQAAILTIRNGTTSSTSINFGWQFNSAPNQNSGDLAPGASTTFSRVPTYGEESNQYQIFDDVNAANAQPYVVGYPFSFAGSFRAYLQVLAVAAHGITELAFGSSSAVVTPGASLLWTDPASPDAAAAALLPQSTEFAALSSPSYLPGAPAWGEYLAPELTGIQAAETLAKEFFFDLYPNLISQPLKIPLIGTDFAPPAPSLGRVEDIVTEPTIKYGWFDGAYTKTAYVAHVDEPYDSTQPDRYFGGWGKSFFGDDFGYEIWKRCRDAWKAHGIKRAETFEAPGVHDAATMGRMYWAAEFYGAKRIDWLAFQPRFLEYTGKAGFFSGEVSSGMPVEIPKALSDFAEYDLDGITTGRLVEWELDPITERARMLVMIAPVVEAGGSIEIWSDTINPAAERILDTVDSALERITDTIEG